MRVLLVGPDLESNLSLRYLASSLRAAGHKARIATFDGPADGPGVLDAALECELVGLSMCFQVRAPEFLALARALKARQPRVPIVAGGHYASCAAKELLERHHELDVVVIHEGEQTLVELATLGSAMLERASEVPGLATRRDDRVQLTPPRPSLADLDALPEPDRTGPARLVAGVPTAYLMGSRGCVNACDYCCITTLHRLAPGPRFRQRAPARIAEEMAALFQQRGVRQFVFHDDNFLVPSLAHNHARIEALASALAAREVRDIALVLKCSPREADPGVLGRLKELGLIRIFMGIESGSQCGLDAIGRRQTVAEAERALSTCEELDISSQYTVIIFHPEATPESMLEDLSFVRRHPAHPVNYCRAEVYAGTPLERRLVESGRAIGDYLGRVYRYSDPRTQRVWDVGSALFAGRCWGKDEILGQAIRLDHQMQVVRRFYEGSSVDRLVRRFRAYQVELNVGTVDLFRRLVELCADPPPGGIGRGLSELQQEERRTHAQLRATLCELKEAVEECSRVALPAAVRPPARRHRRPHRLPVPRHAAAVAVALGLVGSVGTRAEGKERELRVADGKRRGAKPQEDAGIAAIPQLSPEPYQVDHGVAEAAPPPYDRYRRDIGVAEAAPPPYEPPIEPPPPPVDADQAPGAATAVWRELRVTASGGTTVELARVGRVSGAVSAQRLSPGPLRFRVSGGGATLKVTVAVQTRGGQTVLVIEANRAVTVQLDGKDVGQTPVVLPRRAGRVRLVVTDPRTRASLRITSALEIRR